MRKVLRIIDSINEAIGSLSSWLIIAMVIVILFEVIARYVFNSPTTWAFGSMRLIGGAIIVLGWAYAQLHNSHIRVDVFYTHFSARQKALVDILGSILFFFPLLGALTWLVISRTVESFLLTGQILTFSFWCSPSSLYGLVIMIGLSLTCLQFIAQLARDIHTLAKGSHHD
jgi:TRAP-type mannitol/chloroaromatic compound transport system permease small subunit